MKILIIGGTRFVGRHLVNTVRARGHEITIFNRGKTNPVLFRRLNNIRGDRETDLHLLNGQWDAAIDTCGYLPRLVRLSAEALKERVGQYIFISSVAAYANFQKIGIKESEPLAALKDEGAEEVNDQTYGGLKALCEKAVQEVYGPRSLIIRPGVIVGPHDPTDRFAYWLLRIARGGEVLAPDGPGALTQFVDVRDLAEFVVRLAEMNVSGAFNVVNRPQTLASVFETCKKISQSDATFRWASREFLESHNVKAGRDLPLWSLEGIENAGIAQVNSYKAEQAGLLFTSLEDTVKAVYDWEFEHIISHNLKTGLSYEREKELLEALPHVS
ncbi:MAG: NAD-dependent epimerase/dehydratase family protein [Anaerolineales bacterium]|nr:NAD-dependent epimerase/dehydratase family protein [Anaerolineales bacterium]